MRFIHFEIIFCVCVLILINFRLAHIIGILYFSNRVKRFLKKKLFFMNLYIYFECNLAEDYHEINSHEKKKMSFVCVLILINKF